MFYLLYLNTTYLNTFRRQSEICCVRVQRATHLQNENLNRKDGKIVKIYFQIYNKIKVSHWMKRSYIERNKKFIYNKTFVKSQTIRFRDAAKNSAAWSRPYNVSFVIIIRKWKPFLKRCAGNTRLKLTGFC